MGRRKRPGFKEPKMFSARVEADDFYQFESMIKKDGKKLQEVVNLFVTSFISGTVRLSGSEIVAGDDSV